MDFGDCKNVFERMKLEWEEAKKDKQCTGMLGGADKKIGFEDFLKKFGRSQKDSEAKEFAAGLKLSNGGEWKNCESSASQGESSASPTTAAQGESAATSAPGESAATSAPGESAATSAPPGESAATSAPGESTATMTLDSNKQSDSIMLYASMALMIIYTAWF